MAPLYGAALAIKIHIKLVIREVISSDTISVKYLTITREAGQEDGEKQHSQRPHVGGLKTLQVCSVRGFFLVWSGCQNAG